MSNKQIQAMMRSPKMMMDFQVSGRLPREVKAPASPLLELITKIPTRLWSQFLGVKINPLVGFNGNRQFHTLHQVAVWIGHNKTTIGNQRLPYESWMIRGFRKQLTMTDLLTSCSKHPEIEVLKKHIPEMYW